MKINIPNPCHENWDGMTPNEQGRFCGSCQKNVIDFTHWPAQDILNYFNKHRNERVCGRFRNEQLQTIIIQVPKQQLYLLKPAKMLLAAMFLAFGSTLFSCTDVGGKKVKIDKIEIVDEADPGAMTTVGISIPPPLGDVEIEFVPPSLVDSTVSYESYKTGDITLDGVLPPDLDTITEINLVSDTSVEITGEIEIIPAPVLMGEPVLPIIDDENKVYDFADEMPEFPGGNDSMRSFIQRHIQITKNDPGSMGTVYVNFVVLRNGSLDAVEIIKSPNKVYSDKVLNLMQIMPKWKPGKINGKAVDVKMILPIKFM